MIEAISSKWWLLLLRGLAAIIVGVLAFVYPGWTLIGFVFVLAFYSFVAGALALTASAVGVGGDRWWALLLEGILGIVAAILIWNWPGASAVAFVYFVAAWFIVSGFFQLAAGIRLRDIIDNEWIYILSGIISIVFGVWVFRNQLQGAVATAYLFGLYFLIWGILQVVMSLRLRGLSTSVAKAVKAV